MIGPHKTLIVFKKIMIESRKTSIKVSIILIRIHFIGDNTPEHTKRNKFQDWVYFKVSQCIGLRFYHKMSLILFVALVMYILELLSTCCYEVIWKILIRFSRERLQPLTEGEENIKIISILDNLEINNLFTWICFYNDVHNPPRHSQIL